MNPLLSLLFGQQASPTMAQPGLEQAEAVTPEGAPIVVTGQQERPTAVLDRDPYEDFVLNNSDAIRERDAALRDGQQAANRSGMFGTRGTLRDVLGVVGDAFLMQAGRDPLYRMTREQENLSDAMAGYTVDPWAAAERMAGVSPAAAEQFRGRIADDLTNAQNAQTNLASQQSTAARQAAMNRASDIKNWQDGRDQVARILSSGLPLEVALVAAQQALAGRRLSLEDYGIDETMTQAEREAFANSDMTVLQQRRLPMEERRVDISQQNADANTTRAGRGRAPTAASEMARIRAQVNRGGVDSLSAGDRATWDKAVSDERRSRRSNPNRTPGRVISRRPAN